MREKILFSWSGGKDSAIALYEIQKNKNCDIVSLLTTVTEGYDRVSMHGIRRVLLERQEKSLGLPIHKMLISKKSSNEEYESKMEEMLKGYLKTGVSSVAFGDIFLEELRKFREKNLSKVKMKAIFPIWKRDTSELARTFIDLGFKAIITCVDSRHLDKKFAGKDFDQQFLSELPSNIDPCGENGEFHSFVYDGPIFKEKVLHRKGEVVLRDSRFYYCDITPAQ